MIYLDEPIEIKLPNNKNLIFSDLEIVFHDDEKNKTLSATIKNIPGYIVLYKNDQYDALGDWTKEQVKIKLKDNLGSREEMVQKLRSMFPKTLEDHPHGPGTMLSQMLSTIGITSSPTCKCKQRAIEMNEKGNDWCEQNVETIMEWMKEESIKRGIPFIATAARIMVNKAISKSRKLLAEAEKGV